MQISTGLGRSSEASSPNIDAALEVIRRSQHVINDQPATGSQGDLVAGYVGAPITIDEWWSMPDQLEFTIQCSIPKAELD